MSRSTLVLLALSAAAFAFVTSESLPIGLVLPIATDLAVSVTVAGQLVTVYGLVVVLATIPLAVLFRRAPRRPLLSVLVAILVVSSLAAAAAPDYRMLVVTRMVTALSQALFWALVIPTAARLVPPGRAGRAVAVVFAGASLATLVAVPVGAWIGQVAGWRAAMAALGLLAIPPLVIIAMWLPDAAGRSAETGRGSHPDAVRYSGLVVATTLAAAGAFASLTYVTPYLTSVSGSDSGGLGPALLVRGAAGIVGVLVGGALVDRRPWPATVLPIALQALAFVGLVLLGSSAAWAVLLVGLTGATVSAFTTVLGSRVLVVAPITTTVAGAGLSTAFNLGITGGALIGGVVVDTSGVAATVLAAAALSLAALVVTLLEPWLSNALPMVGVRSPRITGKAEPHRRMAEELVGEGRR
jgi:MFS transporter, DHA1 family, inner membrane transport protein